MPISNVRRLAACVAALACLAQAASAADILIADEKSQPESLTVAPGGVLIVGSASTPFVYRVRSGSTSAEKFVDASTEGAGTLFLRHAGGCLHEHVVDMPTDSGARQDASAAAHRAKELRPRKWRTEDSLEPAGGQ
jgi:hypothetical protein